ncbi:MAG: hypothetical protein ABR68_04095 [Microbacteriaceae bacterium BACL28 MAG-120531-bin53]|nr:MAG: hypothetical protein ABR68_04095 [Microbacteriaceae bacterium BACL28 MAG-120531-bin53]
MQRVYDCSVDTDLLTGFRQAKVALQRHEVVVIPTDTVYGIAVDAFSPKAVELLLKTKGRERSVPPPVLIPKVETLSALATDLPLEFARANISALGANVDLLEGDFMELIGNLPQFDLIISNPPYIPDSMVPLDQEVRDYDPALALYGGEDGLDIVRDLVATTKLILREGGLLVLEHADGQSDSICELLLENNWRRIQVHPDSTGRLRAVSATA